MSPDSDQTITALFSEWKNRLQFSSEVIHQELINTYLSDDPIGPQTVKSWFSRGVPGRDDVQGKRICALVRYFLDWDQDFRKRDRHIITPDELKSLIDNAQDIPVTYRLRLKHWQLNFEHELGLIDSIIPNVRWQEHLETYPGFDFVVDEFWCLRAITKYNLALGEMHAEDMVDWAFWHRMLTKDKLDEESSHRKLRGFYHEDYYRGQMMRFRHQLDRMGGSQPDKQKKYISYLNRNEAFQKLWDTVEDQYQRSQSPSAVLAPFFNADETFIWLQESISPLPDEEGLSLISWIPKDPDAQIYLAELRKRVDQEKSYAKDVYFIYDYVKYFSDEERDLLGLEPQ